jgi:hypothetical protein
MTDWLFGAELLAGTGALEGRAGLALEEVSGAACGILAVGFALDAAGTGNAALDPAAGAMLDDSIGGVALEPAGTGDDAPDCAGAGFAGGFGTVLEIVVITGCSQSPVML